MSPDPDKVEVEVEGRSLVLTNLAKVLYPDTGSAKGAVIDYYLRIAPVLLPHIAARPLTLKRYPDGVTGQHFYNKHAARPPARLGADRDSLPAPGSTSGRDWVRYVIAGDLPPPSSGPPTWFRPGTAHPHVAAAARGRARPAGLRPRSRGTRDHRGMLRGGAVAAPAAGRGGFEAFAKTSGGKAPVARPAVRGQLGRSQRDRSGPWPSA